MVLNALKASNRALDFDDFMEDSVFPANAAPKPLKGAFYGKPLKNGAKCKENNRGLGPKSGARNQL